MADHTKEAAPPASGTSPTSPAVGSEFREKLIKGKDVVDPKT